MNFSKISQLSLVIGLLATLGCDSSLYRAETVFNPDGTVTRAIYQPADETPKNLQDRQLWSAMTYAPKIQSAQFAGAISDLPIAEKSHDRPYFAAWGVFESPEALPKSFLKPAPAGLPDGQLEVDYQVEDWGFVRDNRWNETLTDIVSLQDMHAAREELVNLLLPVARKSLERGLGEEYDTSGLINWLETTGKPWAFEASDLYFESRARKDPPTSNFLIQVLADVCKRNGLELRDASGKLLTGGGLEEVLSAYARDVVRRELKRRDGKPVSAAVVEEVLRWLGLGTGVSSELDRLNQATKSVVVESFGSEEAFNEATGRLTARIFGLYFIDMFKGSLKFHYQLQVPGTIVQSNGLLLADNKVVWKFNAGEAYPFGLTMNCRWLVPNSDLAAQVFGNRVLDDRVTLVKFIELVSEHDVLRDAMRRAAHVKSLDPLYNEYAMHEADSPTARQIESLVELLKLDKQKLPPSAKK